MPIANAITFLAIVTMDNFVLVLNMANVNAENALAIHNGIVQDTPLVNVELLLIPV